MLTGAGVFAFGLLAMTNVQAGECKEVLVSLKRAEAREGRRGEWGCVLPNRNSRMCFPSIRSADCMYTGDGRVLPPGLLI